MKNLLGLLNEYADAIVFVSMCGVLPVLFGIAVVLAVILS
jgi:hypothetical protein